MRKLIARVPGAVLADRFVRDPVAAVVYLRMHALGIRRRLTTRRAATILYYPDRPHGLFMIWKAAKVLGLRQVADLHDGADVRVLWDCGTVVDREARDRLSQVGSRVLNLHAVDISKARVHDVFAATFGYSHAIDPTVYEGTCVEKSDTNAKHDGQIIRCPIPARKHGRVYEKVIDNTVDATTVQDIRVPVIGGAIPFVYRKHRPESHRFSNIGFAQLEPADALLSADERHRLIEFCRGMGCDVCEVDVLRDNGDGRIYAVDVNKTSYGPPPRLPLGPSLEAIQLWAKAFEREFL